MVAGIDTTERADLAEARAEVSSAGFIRRALGRVHRFAPTRLTSSIIIINIVGLVILVGGILYSNQSRQSLINARVESLLTQGHIMAAAVASAATIDTDRIVIDPDKLLEMQLREDAPSPTEEARNLDFLINPERAGPVLRRLVSSTTTRARIFDRDGVMVVDSRYFYGRGEILSFDLPPLDQPQPNLLTRFWNRGTDWIFSHAYQQQKDYGFDNGREFPEITAALAGASVSVVRVNDANEIIVSVAVPIQRFRAVLGALVLSTQGGEIDKVLRGERKVVFLTFLVAGLVAILLSVAVAGHIAEPIRRLAGAAERVRRGIHTRVQIPDFTSRRDEIGHLSGALRDMTNALYNRIDAIEAFAADVSHELKNPLTSLRSAVETFGYAKTDEQRGRLITIIKDDVKRLDRLITDISDASRLDAELVRSKSAPVDLANLLRMLVGIANETKRPGRPEVTLDIVPAPKSIDRAAAYTVLGQDNRLGQVVRNLIDNASSFSPPGSKVEVRLRRAGDSVEFTVDDQGPGINPENFDKIFQRFYTDRPEGSFGQNSGLGLSISKQIVEASRGAIRAENRYGRPDAGGERPVLGARFVVRIPAIPEDWSPSEES